jgi:hypothetical protein
MVVTSFHYFAEQGGIYGFGLKLKLLTAYTAVTS